MRNKKHASLNHQPWTGDAVDDIDKQAYRVIVIFGYIGLLAALLGVVTAVWFVMRPFS